MYSLYTYQTEEYSNENQEALLLEQKHSTNSIQIERQYKKDLGEIMKLTTPFSILNRKFNEMDLIRNALKSKKLATERFYDDYLKITNLILVLCIVTKNLLL